MTGSSGNVCIALFAQLFHDGPCPSEIPLNIQHAA